MTRISCSLGRFLDRNNHLTRQLRNVAQKAKGSPIRGCQIFCPELDSVLEQDVFSEVNVTLMEFMHCNMFRMIGNQLTGVTDISSSATSQTDLGVGRFLWSGTKDHAQYFRLSIDKYSSSLRSSLRSTVQRSQRSNVG